MKNIVNILQHSLLQFVEPNQNNKMTEAISFVVFGDRFKLRKIDNLFDRTDISKIV